MTTLLGISGSLTAGGSTRTVVDAALAAAQAHTPDITTDVIDLRDVTISFCDGRPPEDYPDDTPHVLERISAADAYIIGTPIYRGLLHRCSQEPARPHSGRSLYGQGRRFDWERLYGPSLP